MLEHIFPRCVVSSSQLVVLNILHGAVCLLISTSSTRGGSGDKQPNSYMNGC